MYKFDIEGTINKKIKQFNQRKIKVEFSDVKKYLNDVYFANKRISDKALREFVDEDNISDIIDYLMSDAIVNPKDYDGK